MRWTCREIRAGVEAQLAVNPVGAQVASIEVALSSKPGRIPAPAGGGSADEGL